MVEDNKKTAKKKTLSLKLGSSIKTSPPKSFDGGSTVIVERKRARKNISTPIEKNIPVIKQNQATKEIKKEEDIKEVKKSGKILKRLSKEEQKKLKEAKNAADKEDLLKEIGGVVNTQIEEIKDENVKIPDTDEEILEEKIDARPKSFTPEKEANEDIGEKKKPAGNFGRKNLRERKVTIVTALSGSKRRTRSQAAYKR